MKTIFKLMIFSIMLNFAVGIMLVAIPAFNIGDTGGLSYDATYSDSFVNHMNDTIKPSGVVEDAGDAIYRVLDTLNLGFIQRFLNVVPFYTHGLIVILDNMIGRYLGQDMYNLLFSKPFGILYSVMTFMYILFAWSWWTGKSVEDS